MLRAEIVSARQYATPKANSDSPWLEKFSNDGGTVVISGDAKMRGNPHEQKALLDAGFIVFFFARKWNQFDSFIKTAMLLKWWRVILSTIESSAPGMFFEIPFSWRGGELIDVTPPTATPRRRKPGRKLRVNESGRDDEKREI